MKHAVIISEKDADRYEKTVHGELTVGSTVLLAEAEYSQTELAEFAGEKAKWILKCAGSHQFLADSDSGEDAIGYYRSFFDPTEERAVFENGRLVGFYLCTDGIDYSGRGRYNFTINNWGYPGTNAFGYIPYGEKVHVFLFEKPDTYHWKDWTLLVRDPEADYSSYLDF